MSRIATTLAPLLLLLSLTTHADTLTGTVVKIVDGDTLHLLTADTTRHKIRLAGIDAPERGQPLGTKSKEYLATLVAGKDVEVEWHKRDRYKRIVGKVLRNGDDVNIAMVRAGFAWWYRKYAGEQSPAVTSNDISSRISKIRPPRHRQSCLHCNTGREGGKRSGINP